MSITSDLNLIVISTVDKFLYLTFSIDEKVTKNLEKNMLPPASLMLGPHFFRPNARLLFELLSWLRALKQFLRNECIAKAIDIYKILKKMFLIFVVKKYLLID